MSLPETGKGSNPMIADPLRLHDCSLISDGAAAVVLAPTQEARSISQRLVEIAVVFNVGGSAATNCVTTLKRC